jgi:hypothetical protein
MIKRSYIEPKDAPMGVPCRFCDMPAYTDGLGKVVLDGVAVDGKRPLYSHGYCLMNSGGFKQDNYDFSLQDLLPKDLRSPHSNNLNVHEDQPMQMAASAASEEDSIWAFASKNRFIAHQDQNYLTHMKHPPAVQDATRVEKHEEYDTDNTAAPIPPSK